MGCCQPVLAPIENYYTKYEVDKLIESATTSGCCITPEEVDEKIEEAISGISVSGVTEEELNNAIASAKTEIEAEIPTVPTKVSAFENDVPYLTEHQSLSGYATEEWVLDKHYISGVDLSDYALKSEIPTVPTSNTAFTNDAGYLTEHQSLDDYYTKNQTDSAISAATSGYVTSIEMSAFTYDKATIDEKVAEGGTFDPTQYYNKTATNELLDEKLDVTAYTPTDLSNYYNKQEVNNIVESAKTEVEAEIPTVPTSNTAFTNDAGYLTEHQSLDNYYNKTQTDNLLDEKQNTLSAGTGIDITNNVISATGGGGESCTVNEKVIVKPFQMTSYANLDAVYACYSGHTYGQYANVAISGISSWFYNNLNFSTGDYTGSTSGWEDYYTITWDSANARFLFAAKGNYKIQTISSYSLYYQVPLYTISGTPCDAAEELADALGDTITNIDKELENKADYTALYSYMPKSKIWCGTESEYNSIVNKDSETLYLIHE